MWSRSRLAVLTYAVLLAWQIWRLSFVPHGHASTWTWSDDVMEVSATGEGIRQQFLMGADGLDALWLQPGKQDAAAPTFTGTAIVEIQDVTGADPIPLARVTVPAARVQARRQYRVDLPAVRHSRNRTYAVHIRHVGAGDGALRFRARRDRVPPHGAFHVNDEERWGVLVFEATSSRATLPYWKDEVLRPWPSSMRSWGFVSGVLLLFNVALWRACRLALAHPAAPAKTSRSVGDNASRDRAAGIGHEASDAGAAAAVPTRFALFAVSTVVAAGLIVACWPTSDAHAESLADRLGDAAVATAPMSMLEAVAVQPVALFGRAYRAIVALPTSRLAWTVDVPADAVLRAGVSMRPDVWSKPSDGANLEVYVEDNETRTLVARYTLAPFLFEEHRALFEMDVPLTSWAGRRVTLAFETDPERWGNAVNDVPLWVEPRLEWPRRQRDKGGVVPRDVARR